MKSCTSDRADRTTRDSAAAYLALGSNGTTAVVPSPHDAGSAKLLEAAGFEALWTSSASHAFSLGRPDNHVSRDEAITYAEGIAAATSLPLIADLERGFGDSPEDVTETISRAVAAGLTGCSIEDASQRADAPLYDIGLATERVHAAVAAARASGTPFVVTARAENFLVGQPDLDDVFSRLEAYQAAGADILFAPGLSRADDVKQLAQGLERPFDVLLHGRAQFTLADLSAAGVRRAIIGSALTCAAYGAMLQTVRAIQQTGSVPPSDPATGFAELTRLFGA